MCKLKQFFFIFVLQVITGKALTNSKGPLNKVKTNEATSKINKNKVSLCKKLKCTKILPRCV